MRILFVAMANSIHTIRWINQIADQGWDIHLFPVEDWGIHSELRNVTVHNFLGRKPTKIDKSVRVIGSWPFSRTSAFVKRIINRFLPSVIDRKLARIINQIKPDIIHSLEIQHAGYITLNAREQIGENFPSWIVTNWGSDLFIFGRLLEHVKKVKAVLSFCDYYDCECHRDVKLALSYGFKGRVLPILPNTGGFDINKMCILRQSGKTSERRLIILKGYQGWAGRALVGLRAIELCADMLKDYQVAIYLANEDVKIAAELISQSTGIPINIIPYSSHEDILRLHGRARISIGLSIGDGASTSMLEAMVMGSFPIQSCTACADEWIKDGINGMIVNPEDPQLISASIKLAISDDFLVDRASELNIQIARERLDYQTIKQQVVSIYENIAIKQH